MASKLPKIWLISLSFSLFWVFPIQAQKVLPLSTERLITELEREIEIGNRRALRDLASLLDRTEWRGQIVAILERNTFFEQNEIDLANTNRDDFMRFFYENEPKIKFSDFLKGFYLRPIEQQKAKISFKRLSADWTPPTNLRDLAHRYEEILLENRKSLELRETVTKIGQLNTHEAFAWLRTSLERATFGKDENLALAFCEALKNDPSPETLETLITIAERGDVPHERLKDVFLEVTNVVTSAKESRHLLDSLGSVEDIRAFGYEKKLPYKPSFFYEKYAYYARILSGKNEAAYIQRNAMRDLLATQKPQMLFFLAAQVRLKPEQQAFYVNLLENLTKMRFDTEGGAMTAAQVKEYVRWWAIHADEFEWDKTASRFVSREELTERTERYERLFRRLASENDSVALAAFEQLTDGEPELIIPLAEKFRPMLRGYNRRLPDLRYGFLEQITRLKSFARQQNRQLELSASVNILLRKLQTVKSPKERYAIENQIIAQLKIEDVTATELFALLHSGQQEMAFSLTRILDYLYSNNWKEAIGNDEGMRLYLKKCYIFKKIGAVGVCARYETKLGKLDANTKYLFKNLLETESDEDIKAELELLIATDENLSEELIERKSPLDAFLLDPLSIGKLNLRYLPIPKLNDYLHTVQAIQTHQDREAIRLLFDYLDMNMSILSVPHLFMLIADERNLSLSESINERVCDRTVLLLERIYGHVLHDKDKCAAWRKLWKEDKNNYQEWDKRFFEAQIAFLQTAPKLTMDDVNEVTESKYYTPKQKSLIINVLKKVSPQSDLKRLRMKIRLKTSEDLMAFQSFDFEAKDLDDFIRIFDIDNDSILWAFVNAESAGENAAGAGYTADDLGTFYNSLFKLPWFVNHLHAGKMMVSQQKIAIDALNRYLNESEVLSEFEEQTTLSHIAELQYSGMTLAEKLTNSISLEVPDESKAAIQEQIVARLRFADLVTVAPYLNRLSRKPGYAPTAFLHRDFGLPLYHLDTNDIAQLINNLKTMSEYDVYKFYLQRFGVDFLAEDGTPDYNKIYNILKFEIVAPFTGGGAQRDYFTYGVIKLLELHFKNRLGFAEKLNENQTFTMHSATKRASVWMHYLEDNGYVKLDPSIPASFNKIFAGN